MLNLRIIVTIAMISSVLALIAMISPVLALDNNSNDDVTLASSSLQLGRDPLKKAMTWTLLSMSGNSALFGRDEVTDPYQGDTLITERRSLLCVSVAGNLAKPENLTTGEHISPGGADIYSWSGRQVFAIPDILGQSLSSEAAADEKCAAVGEVIYGPNRRFRMAEFHDGIGSWPGWSFWAQAYCGIQGMNELRTVRYWVKINDQPANPW
jgi:hypothetical protein